MNRLTQLSVLLCLLGTHALAADERAVQAFLNINVVHSEFDRVDASQTVVISDGVITAVGPAGAVPLPDDAYIIQGAGGYLMPGLAEMHAHVPEARRGQQYLEDVLFLWVANGVTTVRNMAGAPSHLELREAIASGEMLGPRIYTSGPRFAGKRLTDIENKVAAQKDAGYDFLKVHMGLTAEAYDEITAAARKHDITVAGHVDGGVGLQRALDAKQVTIDHLDAYFRDMVADNADVSGVKDQLLGLDFMPFYDATKMPRVARATAAAGVWNVPTQTLPANFIGPLNSADYPELKYMPPKMAKSWLSIVKGFQATLADPEQAAAYLQTRGQLVRELHAAGAGLLLGSDAPQMMNVPGFSLHKELALLVDAGLTPAEAITAGTASSARFFDAETTFGRVAVGLEADLILVAANPLTSPEALRQPLGVMLRGRWLPREELRTGLAAIANRNRTDD